MRGKVCGAVMLMAVTGCMPAAQPVQPGVGFGSYSDYMRQREAALASGGTGPMAPGAALPGTSVAGGFSPDRAAAAIDAADGGAAATGAYPAYPPAYPAAQGGVATGAVIGADRPRGDAPLTIRTETGEAATVAALNGNGGAISDEQDFGAVSSRETIESDAERIARARQQYQVVQPTAVPERPAGEQGATLVNFALTTSHAPGTPVYRRSGIQLRDAAAVCGRYASADLAQEDFLGSGGPQRDRKGLDPDGDGFVCGWDPRPFRAARQ